jgi:hypothetical protein
VRGVGHACPCVAHAFFAQIDASMGHATLSRRACLESAHLKVVKVKAQAQRLQPREGGAWLVRSDQQHASQGRHRAQAHRLDDVQASACSAREGWRFAVPL